jgi:hypothetical protein
VHLSQRILVLGCPGSGKSALSRELARITGLPLFHLDDYYWGENWKRPRPDQWQSSLETLVSKAEWILDGNHQETLSVRLSRASAVVLLDMPVSLCLYRVARRGVARVLGDTESLPSRIRETRPRSLVVDPRFVLKVALFRVRQLPILLQMAYGSPNAPDVHLLRSSQEIAAFLRQISLSNISEKNALPAAIVC